MNLLISNTKVLTDIIFIKKVIQKSDLKKINKKTGKQKSHYKHGKNNYYLNNRINRQKNI